ncbi:TlpA disulfide reductase family protein [Natronoglomus mannanivorans]|uniref:TlpA family protein disulfide reductase n=1 Tax=Natronoglomus mannanivorans TaxID=2979990 RepID=A0AAP2Z0N9_9EURY|nr:TlpA family protein disulfide reductase [Halobacteria archaeon AArc-xg1-1]
MRRRDLIAGLASVGVVAGGGILATRGPPTDEFGDGADSDGSDTNDSAESDPNAAADTDTDGDGAEEDDDPIELETVEATGSEAGTVTVPESGQVTFVDFFATWCAPCEKQMPALAEAADRVSDDVRFLSVTNEPVGRTLSEDELREWWDDHDGNWLLGVDPTAELNVRYDVSGFPTAVVIDADNRVRWSHQGIASADELVAQIDAVLEGESGDGTGTGTETETEGDST